MNVCQTCQAILPKYSTQITKTEDGHFICKHCYDLVFDELFKGSFTLKQALETITFINEYEKDLKRYLLLFKKHAVADGEDLITTLRKIYKVECSTSEEDFGVPREVMIFNRKSRLDLINKVIPKIDNLYKPFDISTIKTTEMTDIDLRDDLYKNYVTM